MNKKDTVTVEDIKKINDKLVNELKSVETKMNDFNKMFIDTKELQREITKLKTSIINSLTDKNTADTAVVKTDLANIKSNLAAVKTTSDTSSKSVIAANTKIREILIDVRLASGKLLDLETRINTNNTQRISKDEEIKGQITSIENSFNDKIKTADSAVKTATGGLDKRIIETNTKINEVKSDLIGEIKSG